MLSDEDDDDEGSFDDWDVLETISDFDRECSGEFGALETKDKQICSANFPDHPG